MTDQEWLAATDLQDMLEFLRGKASGRKLRLLAVACSRRVWSWIDARGRNAVDVAERFADGLAGPNDMRAARLACREAGGQAAWYAAASDPAIAARNAARSAQTAYADNVLSRAEELAQTNVVRDIFGNPFRRASLDPAWVTPGVVAPAQTIYDARAFGRLPELAGALEHAGCRNAGVLDHCRQPGEHVRGCWVVDLVLGKE
jgi:hypothetical protein